MITEWAENIVQFRLDCRAIPARRLLTNELKPTNKSAKALLLVGFNSLDAFNPYM